MHFCNCARLVKHSLELPNINKVYAIDFRKLHFSHESSEKDSFSREATNMKLLVSDRKLRTIFKDR